MVCGESATFPFGVSTMYVGTANPVVDPRSASTMARPVSTGVRKCAVPGARWHWNR